MIPFLFPAFSFEFSILSWSSLLRARRDAIPYAFMCSTYSSRRSWEIFQGGAEWIFDVVLSFFDLIYSNMCFLICFIMNMHSVNYKT
ncbi:hypothetical protein KCV07_g226, partial [Aureobasidium melanogenum]